MTGFVDFNMKFPLILAISVFMSSLNFMLSMKKFKLRPLSYCYFDLYWHTFITIVSYDGQFPLLLKTLLGLLFAEKISHPVNLV